MKQREPSLSFFSNGVSPLQLLQTHLQEKREELRGAMQGVQETDEEALKGGRGVLQVRAEATAGGVLQQVSQGQEEGVQVQAREKPLHQEEIHHPRTKHLLKRLQSTNRKLF